MGVPGFVSKTYLSFYAVLLCEVIAAVPRVTEDMLSLLLPYLVAGLKGDASKEYTSATLMVLTQLLARAQLANAFLQGEQRVVCFNWSAQQEGIAQVVQAGKLVIRFAVCAACRLTQACCFSAAVPGPDGMSQVLGKLLCVGYSSLVCIVCVCACVC